MNEQEDFLTVDWESLVDITQIRPDHSLRGEELRPASADLRMSR